MKDKLSDEVRLRHIHECIREIESAIKGLDYTNFVSDHVLRIAVVKWLEIIGEAANHISDKTKDNNQSVEWRKMKGMRNVVVHEYFGINYEIIWDAATIFLQQLKKELETINPLNDNFLTN